MVLDHSRSDMYRITIGMFALVSALGILLWSEINFSNLGFALGIVLIAHLILKYPSVSEDY
ncbi:hypothetical protein HN695_03350 [Candidatus Woesearchaeota archaeon]|jgi:hypothetical protein|nr:hypothetical protein [Candidatus Woesearchaeota archaeon]MBT5272021.1 hypothetical protein [Candidatus Woesearchaeota archaeon]MBT6040762.1 hypothetical protein [Candidatus Woesearchaeota archaeon]MBT6336714.1 hypothetical protein [Candidatus Woesearchaeota archaeon]MBT7927347.1 hypothetical protein [Candidatus Woesearchaeota archaeon]